MCGRFVLDGKPQEIKNRFNTFSEPKFFKPSYNITPGMMMPVIKKENGVVNAVLARWGLIPSWAKDSNIGYKMINARAESLLEKPSYRKPFLSQRCLIPANGFYEWMRADKEKIPYFIKLKSLNIFAMAGLYDIWKDAESHELTTFTIITTNPNPMMVKIHNRMPVILPSDFENKWLDENNHDPFDLSGFLVSYNENDMESYPVSKLVNNPDNDFKKLIEKYESN